MGKLEKWNNLEDVEVDPKEIGRVGEDWIKLAADRKKCQVVVMTVIDIRVQ